MLLNKQLLAALEEILGLVVPLLRCIAEVQTPVARTSFWFSWSCEFGEERLPISHPGAESIPQVRPFSVEVEKDRAEDYERDPASEADALLSEGQPKRWGERTRDRHP